MLFTMPAKPLAERVSSERPTGTVEEGVADLLVRDVQVLVGHETEELVLDDGTAERAAGDDSGAVGAPSRLAGMSGS